MNDIEKIKTDLSAATKIRETLNRTIKNTTTDRGRIERSYPIGKPQEFRYYLDSDVKGATVTLPDGTTFEIAGIEGHDY